MVRQPLEVRVDRLEDRVSERERLPAKVTELGTQIAQLRSEMHAEFSAIRGEMQAEFSAVRGEMQAEFSAVRGEIRDGDEETRRQMRVLHEDLVARIALLGQGRPRSGKQ